MDEREAVVARRHGRKRRGKRPVVRLSDSYLDAAPRESPAPGAAGQGPWHVVVLASASGERLYTAMTRDVSARAYASRSAYGQKPYGTARASEHAIDRLVLVETYLCRHTAFARMQRIRGWPVAERRRLVEEANPGWADLGAGQEEGSQAATAWDPRLAAGLAG